MVGSREKVWGGKKKIDGDLQIFVYIFVFSLYKRWCIRKIDHRFDIRQLIKLSDMSLYTSKG